MRFKSYVCFLVLVLFCEAAFANQNEVIQGKNNRSGRPLRKVMLKGGKILVGDWISQKAKSKSLLNAKTGAIEVIHENKILYDELIEDGDAIKIIGLGNLFAWKLKPYAEEKKVRVAVFPFAKNLPEAQGGNWGFSERILARLVAHGIPTVEREFVAKLFKERDFADLEETELRKYAKLLVASIFIFGKVEQINDAFHISARSISVDSGKILYAITCTASPESILGELWKKKAVHTPPNSGPPTTDKSSGVNRRREKSMKWIDLCSSQAFKSWKEVSGRWTFERGTIATSRGGFVGIATYTARQWQNFELEGEFKYVAASPGISFRHPLHGSPWDTGYQLDIHGSHDMKNAQVRGISLYRGGQKWEPSEVVLLSPSKWYSFRLVVNGRHVEGWLEGRKLVDAYINSTETGYISLEGGAEYRNLKIRDIGGVNKENERLAHEDAYLRDNYIHEGIGWRGFRVGATRGELIKFMGKPDNDPNSHWLQWIRRYNMHCLVDDQRGALELRFDRGCKRRLKNGIRIGTSEKKVRAEYGEPSTTDDRGYAKKLIYRRKGILFWLQEGAINQIVVFKPY